MPFEYIKDLEKKQVMEKILNLIEEDMENEYLDIYDSLRIIPREDFNSIYFNKFIRDDTFDNDEWEVDISNFGLRDLLKMTNIPKPDVWDLYMILCRFVWESREKRTLKDNRRIPITEFTQRLREFTYED
jgi:hypothetical protein